MNASTAQSCSITRRTALRTMAVAAATGAISQLHAQPPIPPPQAGHPVKPSLHVYPDYGWLRGFSVVPSWGARIEEAWWDYDGGPVPRGGRAGPAGPRQLHPAVDRVHRLDGRPGQGHRTTSSTP